MHSPPKNDNFAFISAILNLYDFLSSAEHNKDILKNVGNQTILVPINFHCIFGPYNGNRSWNILQNILFFVPQIKKSHASL